MNIKNYKRNIFVILSGTGFAQAIPIAISPILTRLYEPSDFGVMGLYVALSSIIGTIACGRYELAIMQAETQDEAVDVAFLSLTLCIVVSIALLFIIYAYGENLAYSIGLVGDKWIILLLPFSVFFFGAYNVFSSLATREKKFTEVRNATIQRSILNAVSNLSLGLANVSIGLIISQLLSQLHSSLYLVLKAIKYNDYSFRINVERYIPLANKHINFPKYALPAALANTLGQNLTQIFVTKLYGLDILGFHSLSERILAVPGSLLGNAVSQVFYQQASDEYRTTGRMVETFRYTTIRLLVISATFYVPAYVIVEDLFAFIFGESWRVAGEYAKILIPLYFVRMVVSPLTLVNQIGNNSRNAMFWQFGLLLIVLSLFLLCFKLKFDFKSFLNFFSIGLSFYYLFFYYLMYKHVDSKN